MAITITDPKTGITKIRGTEGLVTINPKGIGRITPEGMGITFPITGEMGTIFPIKGEMGIIFPRTKIEMLNKGMAIWIRETP